MDPHAAGLAFTPRARRHGAPLALHDLCGVRQARLYAPCDAITCIWYWNIAACMRIAYASKLFGVQMCGCQTAEVAVTSPRSNVACSSALKLSSRPSAWRDAVLWRKACSGLCVSCPSNRGIDRGTCCLNVPERMSILLCVRQEARDRQAGACEELSWRGLWEPLTGSSSCMNAHRGGRSGDDASSTMQQAL